MTGRQHARILRRRNVPTDLVATTTVVMTTITTATPVVGGACAVTGGGSGERKRLLSGAGLPPGKRRREGGEADIHPKSPPPRSPTVAMATSPFDPDVLRSIDNRPVALESRGGGRGRQNPLPSFDWAERGEVWRAMEGKERGGVYERRGGVFERHPCLHARMRAILIDWLSEVCEVYKLQRETLHLAADLTDRYLLSQSDLPKSQLQLVGVTSLFIAAKMEEIYPPKLAEFSFITDGACTEDEILTLELVMLQVLHWNLSPLTALSWLKVYLQALASQSENTENSGIQSLREDGNCVAQFLQPVYDKSVFVKSAQLLDVCLLDVGSLDHAYSVLAAAAMCCTTSQPHATLASGYSETEVSACLRWMRHFFAVLEERRGGEGVEEKVEELPADVLIQTHSVSIELLDIVQSRISPPPSPEAPPTSPSPPPTQPTPCQTPPVRYPADGASQPATPRPEIMTPPGSGRAKSRTSPCVGVAGCGVTQAEEQCARMCLRDRTAGGAGEQSGVQTW